MKILYLSLDERTAIDQTSGGVTHILSVIEAMRKLGHEVELVAATSAREGTVVGSFTGRWSIVKSVVPPRLWVLARDIYDTAHDSKNVERVERVIDDFRPDAIYERNSYLHHAGAEAARRKSVPYFLEINAPISEERRELFGAPLGWYHDRRELERARFANGIVVVSGVLRDMLVKKGIGSEKVAVFPNAIDPERFVDCAEKGRVLREKIGAKGPVVGFVGSIAAFHGVARLIEAAAEIRPDFPDILVWIVGTGASLGDLKALAAKLELENNVRFEGRVPADEVPAYAAAFDIGMLPGTAYYTSPIKLFEYGAAGAPTIAPRTPAVREVLEDGVHAVLTDSKEELAEAIKFLLNNPAEREKLARNLHRKVMTEHTWEKVASGIIEFMSGRMK